jgi:uncharacterized protein with LGFP repeats
VRSLTGAIAAALVLLPAAPAWAAGAPPVAVADAVAYRNTGGIDYIVDALANDSDPDGDALTYTAVTTAAKGNAYLAAGKLYYKPFLGNTGTDSFTYTVSDGQGNTATGTVTATLWVDPAAPVDVAISGSGWTSATLTWSTAARAASYRIYRNGVLVTETSALTFTESILSALGSYEYHVVAVNGGGFEGPPSSSVYRRYRLQTPWAVAVDLTDDPTALRVTWDGSGKLGPWNVYRDGTQVASVMQPEFRDTRLVTGRQYSYQVQHAFPSTTLEVYPASSLSPAVRATPAVPTDIGRLFLSLGGSTGDLGPVTVPERAVPGGRQQDHARGVIVQREGEAPLTVSGNFAPAYLRAGGVAGYLGFPLHLQECGARDNGCLQFFDGGSIWSSASTAAWVVRLDIEDGWAATGWEEGPLGYPLGDQVALRGGGIGQAFEDGAVYFTEATGSHGVSAWIWDRYAAGGYENGWLGYPVSDEIALNGGTAQNFQGGTIWRWEYGTAHTVHGAIRGAWTARGAETGWLGYPISDEIALNGGVAQIFQHGSMYWSAVGGAHTVHGAIRGAWTARGAETGWLGYPISDEIALRGGVAQIFQHGTMYWSPAGGAHTVHGAIRSAWTARGAENGWLGYPISDEIALRGGVAQIFQHGTMYWSAVGGAHTVHGAIRSAWTARGAENGWLGYPTSDEIALRGGVAQVFQRGSMYWSAAGGAHTVHGAIRSTWAAQGAENGRLGYPILDEVQIRPGITRQDFQGGSIIWQSSVARATVSFNL